MYRGWYQAAYERELVGEITPVELGQRPIALVRDGERIRAIDAACPHRGANLGFGGRLHGGTVVCPFHGKRIGLGLESGEPWWTTEHPTLGYGGLIFVRLGEPEENGLEAQLEGLAADHYFIPGPVLRARVAADMVIENAIDDAHFHTVHAVANQPSFTIRTSEAGEFAVAGEFVVPPSDWQRTAGGTHLRVPFTARVLSPSLVVSRMGGDHPYTVITGATPTADGGCAIRMSLAVPAGPGGEPPDAERCRYLLRQSQAGIEQDIPIWEHLVAGAPNRLAAGDATIAGYREFCRRFEA